MEHKGEMPDKVILTARTADAEWALVERRQQLVILRQGEPLQDTAWDLDEVEAATDAFHQLVVRNIGK